MNQYPLNPVDFYEDFLSFLRGIEKYGDKTGDYNLYQ